MGEIITFKGAPLPPGVPSPIRPRVTPSIVAASNLILRTADNLSCAAYGEALDTKKADRTFANIAKRGWDSEADEVFLDVLGSVVGDLRHGATKTQYGDLCAVLASYADRAEALMDLIRRRRQAA